MINVSLKLRPVDDKNQLGALAFFEGSVKCRKFSKEASSSY